MSFRITAADGRKRATRPGCKASLTPQQCERRWLKIAANHSFSETHLENAGFTLADGYGCKPPVRVTAKAQQLLNRHPATLRRRVGLKAQCPDQYRARIACRKRAGHDFAWKV